jgi:hypothetical protein
MINNFVIEKLAYAIHQKRVRLETYLSADEDWKEAIEAVKYFEDREAPHDYIWENKRKRFEYLYPLYLNLTESGDGKKG